LERATDRESGRFAKPHVPHGHPTRTRDAPPLPLGRL